MVFTFDGLRLDPEQRILTREDREISLTPKTRDLLLLFLRNPGRLVTRQELLQTLWADVVVGDEAVSFQISELRKALGDRGRLLRTIPREGFWWDGEGIGAEGKASTTTEPAPTPTRRPRRRLVLFAMVPLAALIAVAAIFIRHRSGSQQRSASGEWVLVLADDFEREALGGAYVPVSGEWAVRLGALSGGGSAGSLVDLDARVTGDLAIELTASVMRGSGKAEIAVFLCRDHSPLHSGYYFGLGADIGAVAIDRQDVEVRLVACPEVTSDREYRIRVERRGNLIALAVDGRLAASYADPIPLNPHDYSIVRIGTYDGFIRVDNVRLYRMRSAEAVAATVPGDRLYERGDYEEALAEYEHVARDLPGSQVGMRALFMAGQCLLAAHRPSDALAAFSRVLEAKPRDGVAHAARLGTVRALLMMGQLDVAFSHLKEMSELPEDEGERYDVASELIRLGHELAETRDTALSRSARQLVLDRFPAHPLLRERAAYLLALQGSDPQRVAALHAFLKQWPRVGKTRYEVEEVLAICALLEGDAEDSYSVYRGMESEFRGKNARFCNRGIYGQALVLTLMGRGEEAARTAERLKQSSPAGLSQADLLRSEYRAFMQWMRGNLAGAAAELEARLARADSSGEPSGLDRLELALILIQQQRPSGEVLEPLLSHTDDTELSAIASLLSGTRSREEFDAVSSSGGLTQLYLASWLAATGALPAAREALQLDWSEIGYLSPAVCRAYLIKHGRYLPR